MSNDVERNEVLNHQVERIIWRDWVYFSFNEHAVDKFPFSIICWVPVARFYGMIYETSFNCINHRK